MDCSAFGTGIALFVLGIAYGVWIELYVDMVRYRRKYFK
jgi:hypothetical protein